MISAAEDSAGFVQREAGHSADKVHSDLSGVQAVPAAGLSLNLLLLDSEVAADLPDNSLWSDDEFAGPAHILDSAVHGLPVDIYPVQVFVGFDFFDGSLKLPDVGVIFVGIVVGNLIIKNESKLRGFIFQNSDSCFQSRRLNVSHQTPFKSGSEAVVQLCHLMGRPDGC